MIHHVTLLAVTLATGSCSSIWPCEIRPDDRRSGPGQDGVDGDAPSVCCGNNGDDRRSDGLDGVDPRSGGKDGDDRGAGDGRASGVGEDSGFGRARVVGSSEPVWFELPDEPLRRDDESSLTRELPPGSYATTSARSHHATRERATG
jgi:hypothetical protein